MKNSSKAFKLIGTAVLVSFSSIVFFVPNRSLEASETQQKSSSVSFKLDDRIEEIDMTDEDRAYIQALREHDSYF